MLLAPEMMPTRTALVVHCETKIATRAAALPRLPLDEWKKLTITELGVIVAQFAVEARNDLHVHSRLEIVDQWKKMLCRSKNEAA